MELIISIAFVPLRAAGKRRRVIAACTWKARETNLARLCFCRSPRERLAPPLRLPRGGHGLLGRGRGRGHAGRTVSERRHAAAHGRRKCVVVERRGARSVLTQCVKLLVRGLAPRCEDQNCALLPRISAWRGAGKSCPRPRGVLRPSDGHVGGGNCNFHTCPAFTPGILPRQHASHGKSISPRRFFRHFSAAQLKVLL